MITGIYVGVSVVAILTVPLLYRLFGYSAQDDVIWLKERESEEHEQLIDRLASLKKELQQLKLEKSEHQVDVLRKIINDYHSVVETRFLGKKHSPLTYLSAARTVQKTALQNLTDMVAIGHSIASIERNHLAPEQIETDTIQHRQNKQAQLYQEQNTRLDNLLEENRKLFNAMMETAVEVANIKSFNEFERIDTLSRLVSLAEIAKKTDKIHID